MNASNSRRKVINAHTNVNSLNFMQQNGYRKLYRKSNT